MKDLLLTLLHLAVMAAKLCGPGGVRSVMAENLHASLDGHTPLRVATGRTAARADLRHVRWVSYCRDLVHLPVAA
jgi:hypothetical protein